MFTGVRSIDSFAHDFLQSKERRLCAAALVGRGIVNSIVKLSKNALHLFRDRQSKVSRILQQGYTLIGQVEAHHGAAQSIHDLIGVLKYAVSILW